MRTYTVKSTGKSYPLYEAPYDTAFKVFRKHCKIAKGGDPENCIEALGIREDVDVMACYIGSGKDAYVVYKPNEMYDHEHALHFTVPADAGRVRDFFDQKKNKKITSKILMLRKPTGGRTLSARSAAGKRRRVEVETGTGKPVKARGKPNKTRIVRLGVHHRPRAIIKRTGVTL